MVRIKKFSIAFLLTVASCMILILGFQNCNLDDPFPQENDSNFTSSTYTEFTATLPIAKGIRDTNCMDSSQYNACIFWKNPVAQNNMSFTPATTYETDLSYLQIYGVNIAGMTDGYLKNSTYNVTIDWNSVERATANDEGTWKFHYAADPQHRIAQIMTYYWLTYQMSFMQQVSGKWDAEDKNVQVVALSDDLENDAYFSPLENKIVMGYFNSSVYKENGEIESALSADILLHEAAHASFYHGNPNRLSMDKTTHKRCSTTTCCMGYEGCFKAINEGQADFHSVIIFESSPTIGEGVTNNLQRGLGLCMDRDLEAIRDRTALDIYNACGPGSPFSGEIHNLGTFYASLWWILYTTQSVSKNEIIKLFVEHLPLVSTSDTFETVGAKIINLNRQMFNGKYSRTIKRIFKNKGLDLDID